ncbi:hypothetical protein, partial [Pseudomonas lactis]|uniref:hypothetical protein n=1 Tax=Pseudomonas lactis TaxID=1615674 RepID=UPI001EE357A7
HVAAGVQFERVGGFEAGGFADHVVAQLVALKKGDRFIFQKLIRYFSKSSQNQTSKINLSPFL